MGLDMYCYVAPVLLTGDLQVDLKITDDDGELLEVKEFAYWRKFNSLHGWMRNLYIKKGGKDPEFNCNTVRLMPEDLDKLQTDAEQKKLIPTSGFFFGNTESPFSDGDRDAVLEFVEEARKAIDNNLAIVYDSSW